MIQFMRLHWQQDVHYLPGLWLQQTIYEVSRNVNSALIRSVFQKYQLATYMVILSFKCILHQLSSF